MTATRVLRMYHSAVVREYRERERSLRRDFGYDVHVVVPPTWREGGTQVQAVHDPQVPTHVVRIRGRRQPNLFSYHLLELRRIMKNVRPEILDIHEEPFSLVAASILLAARLERLSPKVCVYTAQNLVKRMPPPFNAIERYVLGTALAAYPCSSEAGERLRIRGFKGRLFVLPLGVTPPAAVSERSGPPRVGFIGRLEPYKGGMVAVRAFARAAEGTDAVLEIIGTGSQAEALRTEAASLGIADRVHFTGVLSQDETLTRMQAMSVVLVPSLTTPVWKEQFGRVPAQAMAAGAAVIASDSGSLSEVVGDGGTLVAEGDVRGFASALRELLVDPARLRALSQRGRARALERFTWHAVARGVDEMYRYVLGVRA